MALVEGLYIVSHLQYLWFVQCPVHTMPEGFAKESFTLKTRQGFLENSIRESYDYRDYIFVEKLHFRNVSRPY